MNSSDIKVFFELLSNDDYYILYNGNFIDAVTSKIINITKVSLIQRGELIKNQNRFAYLVAECFQNIIRHGGHKENVDEKLPGFFMAKIKDNYYDLVTGNLIANDKISDLKEKFDTVNSLTIDELKSLYNKTLAEGQMSDKGGAGLGIIDMARKTAQKLEYAFLNISDQKSMFYQRLVMAPKGNILEGSGTNNNIEFGITLHNAMIDSNILVLQKSDFSRGTVMPMLDIVEDNILTKTKDDLLVKVIYQVLIELIQNVNHRDLKVKSRKEGIFLIAKNDSTYSICSGYYVDKTKVNWLNHFISKVGSMSNHELETTYLQRLNLSDYEDITADNKQAVDLGKIIAERFSFGFHEVDNEASIFSIVANIII